MLRYSISKPKVPPADQFWIDDMVTAISAQYKNHKYVQTKLKAARFFFWRLAVSVSLDGAKHIWSCIQICIPLWFQDISGLFKYWKYLNIKWNVDNLNAISKIFWADLEEHTALSFVHVFMLWLPKAGMKSSTAVASTTILRA
jgi:hypothetical protein